jgi:Asp-tRNA(Asn)/Glu-tRNA(Gln) amidotransferase A subunit family amidase
MAYCGSLGLGSTLLPGVLWAKLADGADITKDTIASAAELAGLEFDEAEREMMVEGLKSQLRTIQALHQIPLDNAVAPAIVFNPLPPGTVIAGEQRPIRRAPVRAPAVPGNLEELAFRPVTELSELLRTRKVTSTQLTRMYLDRLQRHDRQLHAVVTLTEQRALAQARAADEEIARGRYRGPLHGIPWGAKDLLAVKGHPTTWGAEPYRTQVIDEDAEVVKRLDAAGAVLVAKLTLGELAQGDVWFGGTTRNPWWPEQGSSGSSAGPGSAVAAGLVAFAIGTETQGSISSPATRNGVTGLRPTYGRVPRTGAMALSWSMDKIGPMCRSAEDCALVLEAIIGPDGLDRTVKGLPFVWNAGLDVTRLRVGYFKSAFDQPLRDPANAQRTLHAWKAQDDAVLDALRRLGVTLVPVEPPDVPTQAMSLILTAEAGAAFQELTLSGRVSEMVQQTPFAWPTTFRAAQFISAPDYINANRARTQAMQKWWELFEQVDVVISPTQSGTNQLPATNLTGNPAVIVPSGFIEASPLQPPRPGAAPDTAATRQRRPDVPTSVTFLGPLYREDLVLAMAHRYQSVTDWHLRRPPGFA